MEMNLRPISIQTDGTNNVLITELQAEETLIPYCCKLMEANSIPGLLPMRHQMMDGVVRLRYLIGGKMRLHDFVTQHRLSYANGVLLLRNLTQALLHLEDYFLSTSMCYLDPEHIYIGDGLRAYLICLPVERAETSNTANALKAFYEKLLSTYFATADCNDYDDMFKWVYKATMFDLETFYNRFLKEEESPKPAASVQAETKVERPAVQAQAAPKEPAKESAPEKEGLTDFLMQKYHDVQKLYPDVENEIKEKLKPREEKSDKKKPDIGFDVPNATPAPQKEKSEEKTSEGKGKKGLWPFRGKATGDEEPKIAVPGRESEPAVQPSPKPQAISKQKIANRVSDEDDWGEGTILVGKEMKVEVPKEKPSAPVHAYFVHNGQEIPITETPFMVGKFNSSIHLHYAIYDNNKVSRSHATFLYQNGQYCIRDNQSRNGTTLNGKPLLPLQPEPLHDGDEIKLYNEVLVFHLR